MLRAHPLRLPVLLIALLALGASRPAGLLPSAAAEGADLSGLIAPELTFPAGLNGVERGTTLSSLRGKVVWLKFWLRDCPRCQKSMPAAQRLHELYGDSGLVVLTVVHQYGPDQVRPLLQQKGWTFRVGCDPAGTLAQAYQVNHRPTDYVIGVDGRVRASNAAPEQLILSELAAYRVRELGRVPEPLKGVSDLVSAGQYGEALKVALKAAAGPDAPPEVRAFAERFEALVRTKATVEIARANSLWRLQELEAARSAFDALATGYAGTALAEQATQARAAFLAAVPPSAPR